MSLLAHLQRTLRTDPVLVVATCRDDELPDAHPLRRWLAEPARGVSTLLLPRFTRPEAAAHIAGILGTPGDPTVVDTVFERSAGNPFLAEVVLADPLAPLPPTVTDLVMRQVRPLSPGARAMLKVAAVVGPRVGHRLLAGLLTMRAEELAAPVREAVEARVLVAETATEAYSFRHALIREAVHEDIPPAERRRLHARVADALTAHPEWSLGVRATATAELAHHRHAAGDAPGALSASIAAGIAATEVCAFAEAHEHFERASTLWSAVAPADRPSDPDRPKVLELAAGAAHLVGHDDRAMSLVEAALAEVDERAEPERAALLYERLGCYAIRGLREDRAGRAYRRALELLGADEPSRARATVLAGLVNLVRNRSRPDECVRYATETIAVSRAVGAIREEAIGHRVLGITLLRQGSCVVGISELRTAVRLCADADDPEELLTCYILLGYGLELAGELADSLAVSLAGYELSRQVGLAGQRGGFLLCNAADLEFLRGRWGETRRWLTEAEATGMRGGPASFLCRVSATLAVAMGEFATAHRWLDRAAELVDRAATQPTRLWRLDLVTAELALAEGRLADARAAAAAGIATVTPCSEAGHAGRLIALALRIEAGLAARGRKASIEALVPLLDRLSALPEQHAWATLCAAELGRATGAGGAAAVTAWARALARWEEFGAPHPAAYTGYRLAEAIIAAGSGDRDRATSSAAEPLRAAARTAAELGAAPLTSHGRFLWMPQSLRC